MWRHREKMIICKPRREVNPSHSLISDFYPSRTRKKYISIVSDTQSVVLCYGSPKTNIVGHKNHKSHWMPRTSCCDVSLRSSFRSDGLLPPSAGNTTGRQPPAISFFQEFALDQATLSQVMPPFSGWSVSKTCCHVRIKAWSLCPTWFNSWKVIWLRSFPWSWLRPLLGLHHTFSASLQFFFLPPLPFHMDWSQGRSLIHFYLFIYFGCDGSSLLRGGFL